VEMSGGACGAVLTLAEGVAPARALFGEWRGGFLLAVAPAGEPALARACEGLPVIILGTARGTRLKVSMGGTALLDEPVGELQGLREKGLGWLSGA